MMGNPTAQHDHLSEKLDTLTLNNNNSIVPTTRYRRLGLLVETTPQHVESPADEVMSKDQESPRATSSVESDFSWSHGLNGPCAVSRNRNNSRLSPNMHRRRHSSSLGNVEMEMLESLRNGFSPSPPSAGCGISPRSPSLRQRNDMHEGSPQNETYFAKENRESRNHCYDTGPARVVLGRHRKLVPYSKSNSTGDLQSKDAAYTSTESYRTNQDNPHTAAENSRESLGYQDVAAACSIKGEDSMTKTAATESCNITNEQHGTQKSSATMCMPEISHRRASTLSDSPLFVPQTIRGRRRSLSGAYPNLPKSDSISPRNADSRYVNTLKSPKNEMTLRELALLSNTFGGALKLDNSNGTTSSNTNIAKESLGGNVQLSGPTSSPQRDLMYPTRPLSPIPRVLHKRGNSMHTGSFAPQHRILKRRASEASSTLDQGNPLQQPISYQQEMPVNWDTDRPVSARPPLMSVPPSHENESSDADVSAKPNLEEDSATPFPIWRNVKRQDSCPTPIQSSGSRTAPTLTRSHSPERIQDLNGHSGDHDYFDGYHFPLHINAHPDESHSYMEMVRVANSAYHTENAGYSSEISNYPFSISPSSTHEVHVEPVSGVRPASADTIGLPPPPIVYPYSNYEPLCLPTSPRVISPSGSSSSFLRSEYKYDSDSERCRNTNRPAEHYPTVNDWKCVELLGKGTYGEVYRAIDRNTGTSFAVKQMKVLSGVYSNSENGNVEEQVQALQREISVMKDLDHPNIVRYLGSELNRQTWELNIFLEYIVGGSIQSQLKSVGPMKEALVRRYTSHIICGIAYLHAKNIIHRDVKGANVLITRDGVAVLADFGCSKQFEGMNTSRLDESLKTIRGSIPWMAPEVVRQEGHGRKADIWSVGCTVLEMFTAKQPWPDFTNRFHALFQIATAGKSPPIPDHLSDVANDFLSKCFIIDQNKRWSAQQLLSHPFLS